MILSRFGEQEQKEHEENSEDIHHVSLAEIIHRLDARLARLYAIISAYERDA